MTTEEITLYTIPTFDDYTELEAYFDKIMAGEIAPDHTATLIEYEEGE